jgi:hypothetical protein
VKITGSQESGTSATALNSTVSVMRCKFYLYRY